MSSVASTMIRETTNGVINHRYKEKPYNNSTISNSTSASI